MTEREEIDLLRRQVTDLMDRVRTLEDRPASQPIAMDLQWPVARPPVRPLPHPWFI